MEDHAQALKDLCRPTKAQEVFRASQAQAEHFQGAPAVAPSPVQPRDQGQTLAEGGSPYKGEGLDLV